MKAYSTDLRERIVNAIKHDQNTPDQAATGFSVSRATVYNYLQLERNLGNLSPQKSTGRKRSIPTEQEAALRTQVLERPDDTLEMHCQTWHKNTGLAVSVAGMQRSIVRVGISLKKNALRQRTR